MKLTAKRFILMTLLALACSALGVIPARAAGMRYVTAGAGDFPNLLTITVTDSDLDNNRATTGDNAAFQGAFSVTVAPANNAPLAEAQSVVAGEDHAKAITLTGSDFENNPLTFIIVTNPEHGFLSGSSPNLNYTPALNYFGADSFMFKVNDGCADSAPATVSIDVTPVNDAPVADNLVLATAGGLSQAFSLSGSDAEGSPLSFVVVGAPNPGTLSGSAPSLTYSPASCFQGEDSFTYKVNDGTLDSLPATVRILVTDFGVYHTISGRVSIGGATLSYDNDFLGPGSVMAEADGNYTILVHSCWTGTITPSKTGYFFTPASQEYSAPVMGDLVNQNYTAGRAMAYSSAGAEDGWVLESTETSNKGGSLNASGKVFLLGDDSSNRQYKAIVSFNTADIPANALIETAVLKIKQSGAPTGANPLSALGNLLVDIRAGYFGVAALQVADFQVATPTAKVGTFNKTPVSKWYSATLNAKGRASINRTGFTQFRLYFAKDDNSDFGADTMKLFSGNNLTGKPELIITYTLP